MGSRKQTARFGAVLAGAAIAVMATALPAFASTTGVVDGHDTNGERVVLDYTGKDGKPMEGPAPTALIGLKLGDGHEAATYCVELDVNTQMGAPMDEAPWDKYPNPNGKFNADRSKVNWILHNSFPTVKLADLGAKTHAAHLTQEEAIAGTQAAIWHYSNGANLAQAEHNADVVALYTFLTDPKNNVGIADEPKPTLTITPDQLKGHAGDKIGPFTVDTTATRGSITLTGPAGLKIVDQNGKEIPGQAVNQSTAQAQAKDTQAKFWVKVPANLAPGSATVKIDGEATLDEGRLFVGNKVKTQTLIIAQSEVVKVSAETHLNWTTVAPTTTVPTSTATPTTSSVVVAPTPTKPGGGLANTGVSIWPAVGVAAMLLAGGAGALFVQRRRSRV